MIKPFILSHLFGSITPEVHAQADRYFNIIALSTPFIALYNSGAAIFRTLNKSRLPMNIMLVMNGLNIVMGVSLIYGCGWGVRHRNGLPVRGQSTKNNARTRKGKKKTVANKKKATK